MDFERSNQHEFNGNASLKKLFGEYRVTNYARFIRFTELEGNIIDDGILTWYDAREQHPTRSEYRLYFKDNKVMETALSGDLFIIARRPDGELLVIISEQNSTVENQLKWLFGIEESVGIFNFMEMDNKNREMNFPAMIILDELGVDTLTESDEYIDHLIEPFISKGFPKTSIFSNLARDALKNAEPFEFPDETIIEWMNLEETMFRRLEKHIVSNRLSAGFSDHGEVDVDGFIHFSLSVQNRRKSRVGHALENHLEEIFKVHGLSFDKGKVTENNSKPDFLFPGLKEYQSSSFSEEQLTMLGVKTTCKDRWRQVLAEAERINHKHLFTLEPGITEKQTDQMKYNNLQLVVPQALFETYSIRQNNYLMNLKEFISEIKRKEKAMG